MNIFRLRDLFGHAKDDMARAARAKADESKVAPWVGRLVAARTERPRFEAVLAELEGDASLISADLIAIAHAYNKGGKKPTSKAAAIAMINKRFVEIVRSAAKNRIAEKARPW